ncbi:MAG TPA: ABC transporter permease [Mobilitalea sp.]|nr:ABC transporter permease [Mobilitalea sp.]
MNKELVTKDDNNVLSYVFPITMVAIALFAIFFINYAHSAFVKGRNKEFGIYMSLGITSRELRKLTNVENIIISGASLIVGMGVGTLFSRLFQMVILSLLEIKGIDFYLDYHPYLLTSGVFLIIFATVIVATYIRMRRLDISGLLREARRSEGKDYSKRDPILGSIGLIIMALSIVFLLIIANDNSLISNPLVLIVYIITAFLGVYLVLSNGGNLIIHLLKKSRFYYKNMLSITELHHKFNQNRKIIFVLSVLSTMTIFLVASPFSLLSLTETIAEMNKNHLEYAEVGMVNKLSEDTIDRILSDQEVTNNSTLKFIFLNSRKESNLLKDSKPVVSVDEYNALTESQLKLAKGEAINIITDWIPSNHGISPGSKYELSDGNNTYSFMFIDSRKGEWVAAMQSFPSDSIVVVSDEDYADIAASITDKNIAYYHFIDFKNWKTSKDTVASLKAELGESELKVVAITDTYEDLKNGYSVFLFVSTVLGVLFIIAGGSVLYFKQFTELPAAKVTFQKLYKIGISNKEMKSIVGKELLAVFFLPLLFGAFLGFSMIYMTTFLVGGGDIIKEFLTNALVVVAIYFMSQGIFYLITRNKYIQEIVKG